MQTSPSRVGAQGGAMPRKLTREPKNPRPDLRDRVPDALDEVFYDLSLPVTEYERLVEEQQRVSEARRLYSRLSGTLSYDEKVALHKKLFHPDEE